MSHLAEAIEAGALRQLRELDLSHDFIDGGDFKALVKAIVAQPDSGCPRLEVLKAACDGEESGDEGESCIVFLAGAMKVEGALQHLRELHVDGLKVGREGTRALSQALSDLRVCPMLEVLHLETELRQVFWDMISDAENMRQDDRRCSRLIIVAG